VTTQNTKALALIVVCVALNLSTGFVVAALKLPFYLDSIGTVLATFLGGFWVGVATGVVAVLVGSLYTPTMWAYALTAVAVAGFTHLARRAAYLRGWGATAGWGIVLGMVTALASAPVTTYLYGGISLAGADAFTAYFAGMGKTLGQSVVMGGLATDPVDKLFTSLIAYALVRRVPPHWMLRAA
jgi:energy-coupling factor transport system substrate-specific component